MPIRTRLPNFLSGINPPVNSDKTSSQANDILHTSKMASTRKPGGGAARRAAVIVLACAAAVGLAVLTVSLIVRPAPIEFSVDHAGVSGFNFTSQGLTASFHVSIWADNRNNKVGVYYDAMEVRLIFQEQTVATAELPPFFQPSHNATEIRVTAAAREVMIGETARREMRREKEEGRVVVDVAVRAWIRFRIGSFRTRHYALSTYCGHLDLYVSSGRSSGRIDCDVSL